MRQFYRQVDVDGASERFRAVCACCGEARQGERLPLLCRGEPLVSLLRTGEAGGLRQRSFNKRMARAVRTLARGFSFCRSCGRWVCDGCYLPDGGRDHLGICALCAKSNLTAN